MLNDLHQPQPAANDFEAALQREPNNGEAHLGLAYANLDLHKPDAALKQADLAAKTMGESRDIHVIRATAFGRQDMLMKAAIEYKAALKFTPNDGALHFGLGNTLFAERHYHDAIDELQIAEKLTPNNAEIYALMARSYAYLQDRAETMKNVQLAIQLANSSPAGPNSSSEMSDVLVSTGESLSTLGDQNAAMQNFGKALTLRGSDRVSVRLAIAQVMAQQGHNADAERQIALAMMESTAGDTAPASGSQYIAAADVFRTMHEYQLSQTYLERAKAAGASDAVVRIGLANNYLAIGDTTRAQAELAAVSASADTAPDYQYLLAEANVYRQQHHGEQALTAFAQASNAEGEDQTAQQDLLQAGADEGYRVTPNLSLLADASVEPIFEDTTVYVLDSKLDATFPVPITDTALLPPPRSSIESQGTAAFHLHLDHFPTTSGFIQARNSQGQISVPSTNTIVNRNTTDINFNYGVNPTFNIGHNTITLDSGIQGTVRRDTESPVQMNQNLFREFTYVSTSSFFNVLSASGYIIHESGPFTESNLHSSALSGAVDFRVGSPWGKTALVTGWGRNDEKFNPIAYEDYYTSSYIGLERKFKERLTVAAMVDDLRAWRVVGSNSGIAQNLRPAGNVSFIPKKNWVVQFNSAYSSNRGFHIYDAIQNGFSVSYSKPIRHKYDDKSGDVELQYPIQFSAGLQQESFFNFTGGQTDQLRKICLVATFPPSGRQLNEYAFHIAKELQRNPEIELTILADELSEYEFATDQDGKPIPAAEMKELPGFNVIRCWKFGTLATPVRLLNTIRQIKPDVVWYNLVFSSFATPENPVAALAGLSAPALTRAAGFFTHITLHHVLEHVDFAAAGVRQKKLFQLGTRFATKALLKAHSVSVLLPGYRHTLITKYAAQNVLLGTHGTFASIPTPPDFSLRNNPEMRILAIGHWGTYKRLETLMEAFPAVLQKVSNAKLIIAGANHHTKAGYWEAIRDTQPPDLPIEFRGYVPEEDIPELFRTTSIVVMPYDSSTGSSGPAHQACEYGVPIVCADIDDFHGMAAGEGMAIRFFKKGDPAELAEQLIEILESPELQHQMAEHNYQAGVEMTITSVVKNYLRWFELKKYKQAIGD
jgi:glycosyltransferase involved in cell wall biosynthesis/Tfp pilus assembly protein PilF